MIALLVAFALAQDPLQERIASLEKRLAETKDEGEQVRLQQEIRQLRQELNRNRRDPGPPGPDRTRELEKRLQDLRAALEALPQDAPERPARQEELRRTEEELKRLRPPRVVPPIPPVPERRRPFADPNEVRKWLQENEPETFLRLQRAQEEGRRPEVLDLLAAAEGRMAERESMKERDPQGFQRMTELRKLEGESLELAEAIRKGDGGHKEQATVKLKDVLGRLFDLREEQRARELAELRKRVEDLEKALNGRKASKDRIVDRRKRQLLGEPLDDEW
jgi:NTP pyrophosphatase (non-canonical NTP hydrolase)